MTTKRCSRCKQDRDVSEFGNYRRSKDGLFHHCKSCTAERKLTGEADTTCGKHAARRNRLKVLQHYSGSETPFCACCNIEGLAFLAIDHVSGGGNQHRKSINPGGGGTIDGWLRRNGFPEGFRVLCHNCNHAIGAYGICPHEAKRRGLPEPGHPRAHQCDRMCSLVLEAARNLIESGYYPSTAALAVEIGNLPSSRHAVRRAVNTLRQSGKWVCEISSIHYRTPIKSVTLADGTKRDLKMTHPGTKITKTPLPDWRR